MPKHKGDWESEYHDPISDEEERKLKEWEEQQNAEIMAEIEAIREQEDWDDWDKLCSDAERAEREAELESILWEDLDAFEEEEDEFWSRVPLPDEY